MIHNDIGIPNGEYFGMTCGHDESEIEIISVPWDATVSFGSGTSKAPQAIIDASIQVDLFDTDVEKAWEIKVASTTLDLSRLNGETGRVAATVISRLEKGDKTSDADVALMLEQVNAASGVVNGAVYDAAKEILDRGKTPALVGGDHSVPFGLIKAVAERHPGVGILHIDAHADLRRAYEGFVHSHASIMYNVTERISGVARIVQVAVRDFCEEECLRIASSGGRIVTFTDDSLKANEYEGMIWSKQCSEIISCLPDKVYVSFDIDGLCPSLCPGTGTPVPGGLDFPQAMYLLKRVALSGREIVGFDLCEVAPRGIDSRDANVGARALFKLCCYTRLSGK
jgi:agmatinase